jgi:hypothetical protein
MPIIKIFMPMSGNIGDTLNVMPVLSGIYKSTGNKISLVVRDKMRMFNGFADFMRMQECIASISFESDVVLDSTFCIMSLVDKFTEHPNRPWETVRLEEFFRQTYNLDFDVDDDFVFSVDEIDHFSTSFLVGDRMSHPNMDQRRKSGVLEYSGKFPLDRCTFLDYNTPMAINAAYIKYSDKPIFTTFTGISIIADLLKKKSIVLWGEDIRNFDNKPIEYSYNKHFYRDRKSELVYLGDFNLNNYEVTNEV